ncbi:MAG: MFS transporter [Thermoplasmata archaeon]|uniref:MFS transporter n=1 Tax=Candidatus Sysuiplasma superficiale TaxID=2823368 RepID=A0A8J8CE09_9ARCH|nr:MFS transporter [Candidatus Sysuiplasma superficiale]MBX8644157.1 MFS transporter [Candidatus Sysuiplasma superficiale]MCL4346686.1 MFS transporter [Candidatus Thermoplasmatota archaeon]
MNKTSKTGYGSQDSVGGNGTESPFEPMDRTGVKRYHLKTILIAGMGFFTDAYDLFVIGVIAAMFSFFLPFPVPNTIFTFPLAGKVAAVTGIELISSAAIFGAAIGPFIFGRLGDLLGRKTVYGLEMLILVFGAIASSLSWSFASLVIFRFILGLGIGGDYPMSATIMSEYSNVRSRGKLIGTVFAMQGFGLIAGIILGIGLLAAIPTSLNLVWRLLLLAGAIPAISVYYFRRRMPETPRFTYLVKRDSEAASKVISELTGKQPARETTGVSQAKGKEGSYFTLLSAYLPLVFGTALSWFLFDISFYGTSIYTPTLLNSLSLIYSPGLSHVQHLLVAEEYTAVVDILFTIPGYWIAVATIDRVGRKTLQTVGFSVMAVAFAVLGFYPSLIALGIPFVGIYGLTFLFGNIGPNTTTFVIPSECFPTRFRGTGHGIAAGSGKLGAALSTLTFGTLILVLHDSGMMLLLSFIAFIGVLVTLFLIKETKQVTLEEASEEWSAPAVTE